jgi:hypothetical protein
MTNCLTEPCAMKTHNSGELGLVLRRGGVIRVQRVAVAHPLSDLELVQARTATLKIGAECVLVRGIVRHEDGSFTGRVYGRVTEEQSIIANGDVVAFEEGHVFSYGD